ncbi:unnamed protein product, partial [Urochloa humidicola]
VYFQAGIARIGPWGGDGKVLHDIKEKPHHLQRVTIFSGTIINSLEYLYKDHNGQQHTAGPWGGCGGTGRKVNHMDLLEQSLELLSTFRCRAIAELLVSLRTEKITSKQL